MSNDLTLGQLLEARQPFSLGRIRIVFTPEGWAMPDFHQYPSGSALLPVLGDGRIVLVQENRLSADGAWKPVWNLMRGGREKDDDSGHVTALREAHEEAGLDIPYHRLVDLGVWHPDQGMTPSGAHCFAAVLHGLDIPEQMKGLDGETHSVKAFTPDQIVAMALRGELSDMFVPAVLWLWAARCRKEGWTSSGTRNVSTSMTLGRVGQAVVDAWEAVAKAYPHAFFERKGDHIRFSITWVPLDPPVPGRPPLPALLGSD